MSSNPLTPLSSGLVGLCRRLFGPAASELGEFLADRVRSYRSNNLRAIITEAEKRLSNQEIGELPLRFSIPFFERSSLADEPELVEKWANLLCSAAIDFTPEHVAFVDILARLTPSEARLLDRLVPAKLETEHTSDLPEHYIFKLQTDGAKSVMPLMGAIISKVSFNDGELSDEGKSIVETVVNADWPNMIVEQIRARDIDIDSHREWFSSNKTLSEIAIAVDLLQSVGLIQRLEQHETTKEVSVTAVTIVATSLGFKFANSCRATTQVSQ